MKIRPRLLLTSLIATSLTLFCALKADGAQRDTVRNDAGHDDAGMCRRAPAPIQLAAEPPVTIPPPHLPAAPVAPPRALAAASELRALAPPPSPIAPPPSSPDSSAAPAREAGAVAGEGVAKAEEIPETVLITGSLIRGTAAVGVPVTNLSPQDFGKTGTLTTSDLFRTIPQFSSAPATAAPATGLRDAPSAEAARGPASRYRERATQAPPAGLLTAGDHDDLLNPLLYARYVDGALKNEPPQDVPRVDTGRVLAVNVQDRSGRPVPFAPVTLTCADGNRLTLPTAANGSAVFFPELDRLGERVTIFVPGDVSERARVFGPSGRVVALSGRGDVNLQTIAVSKAAPSIKRFDLALVVDTTGSMTDELEYLKSELGAILADLDRDHPNLDVRVALVAYRDVGDVYVTRTFPFTSDIAALRADLSQQRADGGGDYPEAVDQAMARAVALDWRPDAVKSILFVADAPPHAENVAASWQSAEVARAKRIHIVPVGASGVGPAAEYVMRAMAALTQSRYIFLTDDSGIGNPHAEPAVDCYLVTKLGSSIRRVLDSQISGRRVEPEKDEIIRTVGDYDRGRCIGESQRR
jgi:von Willebrand factor type A domain